MTAIEMRVREVGSTAAWMSIDPHIDFVGSNVAAKIIARLYGQWQEIKHNAAIEVCWKWTDDPELHIENGPFSKKCGVTALYD